jgi:hypothetical protein
MFCEMAVLTPRGWFEKLGRVLTLASVNLLWD